MVVILARLFINSLNECMVYSNFALLLHGRIKRLQHWFATKNWPISFVIIFTKLITYHIALFWLRIFLDSPSDPSILFSNLITQHFIGSNRVGLQDDKNCTHKFTQQLQRFSVKQKLTFQRLAIPQLKPKTYFRRHTCLQIKGKATRNNKTIRTTDLTLYINAISAALTVKFQTEHEEIKHLTQTLFHIRERDEQLPTKKEKFWTKSQFRRLQLSCLNSQLD